MQYGNFNGIHGNEKVRLRDLYSDQCGYVGVRTRLCSNSSYFSPAFSGVRSHTIAFTNVPLIVTVGATTKKPMVVDDEIKIRNVINVTLTLDHRYTDGARAAPVYQKFLRYLHDPEKCGEEEAKELTNEA